MDWRPAGNGATGDVQTLASQAPEAVISVKGPLLIGPAPAIPHPDPGAVSGDIPEDIEALSTRSVNLTIRERPSLCRSHAAALAELRLGSICLAVTSEREAFPADALDQNASARHRYL